MYSRPLKCKIVRGIYENVWYQEGAWRKLLANWIQRNSCGFRRETIWILTRICEMARGSQPLIAADKNVLLWKLALIRRKAFERLMELSQITSSSWAFAVFTSHKQYKKCKLGEQCFPSKQFAFTGFITTHRNKAYSGTMRLPKNAIL